MVVLIIFPVILQTVINVRMLSIGGLGSGITGMLTDNGMPRTDNVLSNANYPFDFKWNS